MLSVIAGEKQSDSQSNTGLQNSIIYREEKRGFPAEELNVCRGTDEAAAEYTQNKRQSLPDIGTKACLRRAISSENRGKQLYLLQNLTTFVKYKKKVYSGELEHKVQKTKYRQKLGKRSCKITASYLVLILTPPNYLAGFVQAARSKRLELKPTYKRGQNIQR